MKSSKYILYTRIPTNHTPDIGYLVFEKDIDDRTYPLIFETLEDIGDYLGAAKATVTTALHAGGAISGFYIKEVTSLKFEAPTGAVIESRTREIPITFYKNEILTDATFSACGAEWGRYVPLTVDGVTHRTHTLLWLRFPDGTIRPPEMINSPAREYNENERIKLRTGLPFSKILKCIENQGPTILDDTLPAIRTRLAKANANLREKTLNAFELPLGGGYTLVTRTSTDMDPKGFPGVEVASKGLSCMVYIGT